MISNTLSDLFFNFRNENYENLFIDENSFPTREEMEKAIRLDAQDFYDKYYSCLISKFEPEDLVEDFLGRI